MSHVEEKESGELQRDDAECRAIAARAHYLAQDRADIRLAAKEISRFVFKPESEILEGHQQNGIEL